MLDAVDGAVPILVEIKSEWDGPDKKFVNHIAKIASAYRGPVALMSFDPAVMTVMRELAPKVPRGIVSGTYAGAGWWNRKISKARNRKLIGKEFSVLVEGPSQETDLLWECRLQSQAPEIDGVTYINDFGDIEPTAGQIRRFRVTEAHDYDLIGMLTDEPEASAPPARLNLFPILTGARPESATHRQHHTA